MMRWQPMVATGIALAAAGMYATGWPVGRPMDGVRVLQQVRASVFVVRSYGRDGILRATGSAVALSPGVLVTSEHVVEGAERIRLFQGGRSWAARLERADRRNDVCLLLSAGAAGAASPMQLASRVEPGEVVYAVGAPEGIELIIAQGLVSGERTIGGRRELVTSAPISAGSSGGGLFDARGELVGLTRAAVANGEDLGLAVPAAVLAQLLHEPGGG